MATVYGGRTLSKAADYVVAVEGDVDLGLLCELARDHPTDDPGRLAHLYRLQSIDPEEAPGG